MTNDLKIIGAPLKHDSAAKHVSGEAIYIDDQRPLKGQLYAYVGGSEIPHGSVKTLDLSAVQTAPGVLDVITAQDIPGHLDIGPVFPGDPLLVKDTIEFVGQPLFAVLACSHQQACKAAQLAKIEYEEKPPILKLDDAIEKEFYVRPPHIMQRGEAQQALTEAPLKIEDSVYVGGQEHFYLEGQAALAVPEEDNRITVFTSTQNPTEIQKLVAEVLAVSMHHVDVITRRMGGGFGGKETQAASCACIAAVFARRSKRPVSFRLSRREDMVMTGKRHPFKNHYEAGCDHDGNIKALRYVLAGQCGNSPDLSDAIVDRAMFHCDNAYYIPDIHITGLRCKTHTVSNTAFRGFGGPQGMMAMETVIDHIAYATQQDPLNIRKKNLYNTTDRNQTPYHQTIQSFPLTDIIQQLESESEYWLRREQIADFNRQNAILKKGLALTPVKFGISFTVSHLNQAGALIHIYSDGSVHLNHGGTEMGQGLFTKVQQIVAAVFSINPDRIMVSATRTDKVPNTSPTAASSGTDINGMAAYNAAQTLKERLITFLSEQYDVPSEQIIFKDGEIHIGDNHHLSFDTVANEAWLGRVSLSATGLFRTVSSSSPGLPTKTLRTGSSNSRRAPSFCSSWRRRFSANTTRSPVCSRRVPRF